MPVLLALLCLPLLLTAQVTIEPRRLDDSLFQSYFYPLIEPAPDGNLLCAWASTSETTVGAYGQTVTLAGADADEGVTFDEATPETYLCPPKLMLRHTPGSDAHLIFHS